MSKVVWHIFGTMNLGGAELRTVELGTFLERRGYRFDYVALSGGVGVLDNDIARAGGLVHHIRFGPAFPVRFIAALRRSRPDVIDSHVATFSGLLMFLAWLARVPIRVSHFHSDGDGHPNTVRRRLQRRVMVALIGRYATHVVGVAPGALSLGYKLNWQEDARVHLIPNGTAPRPSEATQGTALRDALGLPDGTFILIHVGRPSPEKNRMALVDVLGWALAAGIHCHLVLVGGDGADSEAVRARIAECKLHHRVSELGERGDVAALLAQADVMLLTSDREGLPGVVVESIAAGTRVVSRRLPGVEFIDAQIGGILFADLEDPDSWVHALVEALSDLGPDARAETARRFRGSVFELQSSGEAHAEIYG